MGVTGTHFVTLTPFAREEARDLCPKVRDFFELRAQALKLRFWPGNQSNKAVDLDWCWVRALKGQDIGELVIDDTIGGNNNLRIYFYQAPMRKGEPMPRIWLLSVIQKKDQHIRKGILKSLEIRRRDIVKRFY